MWTDAERQKQNQEFEAFVNQEKHLGLMIRSRVQKHGDSKIAVRHKPYGEWISFTWKQFGDAIDDTALSLLAWDTEESENIGIFSANRAEFAFVDYAIAMVRGVSVPIYATNSTSELEYVVNHAEIRILFVGDHQQYTKALSLYGNCPTLQKIVVFDQTTVIEPAEFVMRFDDFMTLGKRAGMETQAELMTRLSRVTPNDVSTILYTSGTAGIPKGVVLSHKNWLAMVWSATYYTPFEEGDVSLSFLPLSHVFDRAWSHFVLCFHGQIDYCHDLKALPQFLVESRPHWMVSAPRIWERIYSKIMQGIGYASPIKQAIFNWSLEIGGKVADLNKEQRPIPRLLYWQFKLADKMVLSKIRAVVGGRLKTSYCGGSAVSADVGAFFYKAGVFIGQGYGLTECFVVSVSYPQKNKFGACGPVTPLTEARITEEGEIQVKSPSMLVRYYLDPEWTARTITPDGFLKTRDLGYFDENGYLVVTDRIKDIIKTADNDFIAPQRIENLLKEDFYIDQCAVIGEGRNFLTALIVPDFVNLKAFAQRHNITYGAMDELLRHQEIIAFYRKRIDAHTEDLGSSEKIRRFTLLTAEFTQETGVLTATQKLKRKTIDERYNEQIEAMYCMEPS